MKRAFQRTIRDADRDPTRVTAPRGARLVFLRVTSARFGGSTAAAAFTPRQARLAAKALLDAADLVSRGAR